MVKESYNVTDRRGSSGKKHGSLDKSTYKEKFRTGSSPLSAKKTSNIYEVGIVKVAKKGLGIGLASFGTQGKYDYGIYVKYIAKGSPASTQGNLRLKDVLLSINHESLDDKSVDDIYRVLRNLPPGPVNLLIKRTSNLTDDGGDVRISLPKKEGKGEIATLMAPALPSKARQAGPIIRHEDLKSSRIPVSTSLKGSKTDLRKEMLNKQNWFNESASGKKPMTKNSLGIEYGRNVNSSLREKRRFSDDVKEDIDLSKAAITNQIPDQAKLDTILQPVKSDSTLLNNPDLIKSSLHSSPFKDIEVPEGMEPYDIDIIKDEKASLGISLVPATGKCFGLFLVRFIFPGTAAAINGKVFCGDCIFSVNGIKLSSMSHPQAIHLLKKCTNKCKLIVFREKKQPLSKEISKKKRDNDIQADILPGTISDFILEKSKYPVLKEKYNPKFLESSSSVKSSSDKKLTTRISESEDTEDERFSDNKNTIPNTVSTNKRSKYGPFLIEVEKKSKTLGLEVMMDESGQCYITGISKTEEIAHDKRIRVGDILLAINNQSLSGKPISDVKSFIRSIPRGEVKLILKTADVESESSQTPKSVKNSSISDVGKRDGDSVSQASSFGSNDDHSDQLSVASLALPPDNSNTTRVTTTICKEQLAAPFDDDSIAAFIRNPKSMRDDMSEVASLPPAPPRPVVSQKMFDSMLHHRASFSSKRDDVDAMSDVMSLPPAPPRPTASIDLMNDLEEGSSNDDDSMANEVGNIENDIDSDVESMFSCIPAPPPPIGISNVFQSNDNNNVPEETTRINDCIDSSDSLVKSKVYAETPLSIMAKSGSLLSLTSGSHKDIISNYSEEDEETTRRKSVINYLELNEGNNSNKSMANDGGDKNMEEDEDFTPAIFDIKEILESPSGSANYRSRNTSLSSHESISVFPEGIVVYNDSNSKPKKNLFSKLKSKILLPSKGNAKEYSSPTRDTPIKTKKEKKNKQRPVSALEFYDSPTSSKDKKKKKRPVSALDFSDESARTMLKASISQPDLTTLSSREVDLMFQRQGSEPREIKPLQDWMVDSSKQRNASPSSIESAFSSKSRELPRILPDKKMKTVSRKNSRRNSSDDEKKYKKRNSYAPSVSPPRTPPPPPPSEFNINDETDDTSPNEFLPPNEPSIEDAEKLISSGEPIYAKSMSDSSSSIPGSYAAYGPTITSANASLENLDTTYDIVDGKVVLNHTYDTKGKPTNVTYDVKEETTSDVDDNNENPYESIDSILTKPSPPQKPNRRLSTSSCEPKLTSSHVPSEQNSFIGEYHQVGEESPPIPVTFVSVSSETKTISTSSTTFTIPTKTQGKRQPSLLSDKDKYDPKLQPFIMTQGVSALLSTWPSKTSSSPYSEYDDDGWGSEFSSNVLDSSTFDSTTDQYNVTRRLSALNNLENTADGTYTIEYCNSTTENPSRNQPTLPLPLTPKPKGGNLKQFFSRTNKNENGENGGKLSLGKKEKQKVVRPTILPDSENQIQLFSESSGPSAEKVIHRNDSLKTKKNPIAKPPRRKSGEHILTSSSESPYENLSSYNRTDDAQEFRPVPPILDSEEIETAVLSPEEHQLLYATVDYGSKINRRQDANKTYTLTNSKVPITAGLDEDNGYISDGTVYSVPERNNSPEFNPQGTSTFGKDRYNSIKDAKDNSGYTTVVHHGFSKERHNQIFGVELTKEHGKCLGISLIGGSDTPIVKNLIKCIDQGSIASRCRIPLEPGDEIIEVNGTMVVGFAHSQLLSIIRESPPLLKFQIHRSADGNIDLLRQQRANEKKVDRKIEVKKTADNITTACHNTDNLEIFSLKKGESHKNEDDANGLTAGSFEHNTKHGQLTHAQHPFLPQSNMDPNVKVVKIELHKEDGRGLGISVAGGPKLVITNGIKVKRLAPNSVAYIDGRLQKDDRIVAINGKDLHGMTQGDALSMLQNIKTTVILTIHRIVPEADEHPPHNIFVSELDAQPDQLPEKPLVGILKKSSSETHLPKMPNDCDKEDSNNDRISRSETRKNAEERSRSENRELKRKSSTRSRSRSPGIFSRLFRGSERSLGKTRKNSGAEIEKQPSEVPKEKILSFPPQTIYFGKTSSNVDFTLTRGGTMYGDAPPVVQTIRKGTALAKTLLVGDMILSVNGVDLQDYSDAELKKFLRALPKGTYQMVVRRV